LNSRFLFGLTIAFFGRVLDTLFLFNSPVNEYLYNRQIIAYHGCDASIAKKVLFGGEPLLPSEKAYDWLGKGIYFWEHGAERAMDWAVARAKSGKIEEPAVVGAILNLGNCFDLLDIRYTTVLSQAWNRFVKTKELAKQNIPTNTNPKGIPRDRLLRYRDCAVINWTISQLETQSVDQVFDAVRGVFQEDSPVYEGSEIRLKSHIQIAIRNPACIVGYFRPSSG